MIDIEKGFFLNSKKLNNSSFVTRGPRGKKSCYTNWSPIVNFVPIPWIFVPFLSWTEAKITLAENINPAHFWTWCFRGQKLSGLCDLVPFHSHGFAGMLLRMWLSSNADPAVIFFIFQLPHLSITLLVTDVAPKKTPKLSHI